MNVGSSAPDLVSVDELKAYLRIETDAEDALLAGLIRTASATVEAWCGQLLVTQERVDEGITADGVLPLSGNPVRRVETVARQEADGSWIDLPPEAWTVEMDGWGRAYVRVGPGGSPKRLRCRYRAGMAETWNAVPEPLRQAVIRAAAHAFTHRDGAEDAGIPAAVRQLVAPFRVMRAGGGFAA